MNNENTPPPGGTGFGNNAQGNIGIGGNVHGNVTINNEAKTESLASLHQIPSPPRDFTGREAEIKELMEMLEHGGVTISGLQGLGGVGKTTLALKLAEALKDKYLDAQFYLDLKGADAKPLPATDALAHVIRAYHPTAKLPESVDDLRALYLSVLHEQRALLLMDNARDEQQVEPLIPPPGCLLLVTSRFTFTVPGLKVKHLDALLPEDAVNLLLDIAPRIGDYAAEIARLCGNLPFGLRAAASVLAVRPNHKVADYARKLSDNRKRLELIEAPLSLSYDLLREELQANWRALSVFPDSFDQRAAAAIWDLDEEQAQERLGELLSFSLVEWNEETDRYRLHDLACVFADDRVTEAEHLPYQQRHAEHYLQILWEAERLYQQGGETIKLGLALFDREWINAQSGWEWAIRNASSISLALKLCSEYPDACTYIADFRRHPRERIVWREAGLAAAQVLGWKEAEGWHLSYIGIAYSDLGNYRQAITFYERWLNIARMISNRKGESRVLNLLGIAYHDLGETQRAIEFYKQSLAIAREIVDRRGESNGLNNLGAVYKDLGEPRRTIEFCEQSLAITREIGDRRGESNTLNNLGVAYKDLGQTHRAIEFYEQSLPIFRELGDRKGEGSTLGNLGDAYKDLGEIHRAIEFYEQCLAIAREIGDRSGEGSSLWNVALALDALGNRTQAIYNAEAALVIKEQVEAPSAAQVREQLEEWRSESSTAA